MFDIYTFTIFCCEVSNVKIWSYENMLVLRKPIVFDINNDLSLNLLNKHYSVEQIFKVHSYSLSTVAKKDIGLLCQYVQIIILFDDRKSKSYMQVNNAAESGIIYLDENKFKDGGAFVSITFNFITIHLNNT